MTLLRSNLEQTIPGRSAISRRASNERFTSLTGLDGGSGVDTGSRGSAPALKPSAPETRRANGFSFRKLPADRTRNRRAESKFSKRWGCPRSCGQSGARGVAFVSRD